MTLGLILLAIMAVTLLFDVGRHAFRGIGIPVWMALLTIVAFAIGISVPNITFGTEFTMNVGGFGIPIIAMFVLLGILIKNNAVLRGVAAMLAVVASTTVILLLMPTDSTWLAVLTSVAIGVVAGALGYVIGRSETASIFAVTGGVAVGNIVYAFVNYFAWGADVFTLGQSIVYNGLFIGAIFALALCTLTVLAGRMMDDGRFRTRASSFESSKDNGYEEISDEDDFTDDLF